MFTRNNLRAKLRKKQFVVTVEINPPKGTDTAAMLAAVEPLKGLADAVNITDNPMANLRMNPITLAYILQKELRLEAIFHLTCRDRNLLGLQSELLGAAALGVNNFLALTGDTPERGDHPQATGIFDVDSVGLVRIAKTLNSGVDLAGNALSGSTDFLVGAAVNPAAPDLAAEVAKLEAKVAAGAGFAQTQPIYDLGLLERFQAAVSHLSLPILVGVLPLKSLKNALFLQNHVPGIIIPETVLERLQRGGKTEGLNIAREFVSAARSLVSGVHIMPMHNHAAAVEAILTPAPTYTPLPSRASAVSSPSAQ